MMHNEHCTITTRGFNSKGKKPQQKAFLCRKKTKPQLHKMVLMQRKWYRCNIQPIHRSKVEAESKVTLRSDIRYLVPDGGKVNASVYAHEWGRESRIMFQKPGMIRPDKKEQDLQRAVAVKAEQRKTICAFEGGKNGGKNQSRYIHMLLCGISDIIQKPSYTYDIPWGWWHAYVHFPHIM